MVREMGKMCFHSELYYIISLAKREPESTTSHEPTSSQPWVKPKCWVFPFLSFMATEKQLKACKNNLPWNMLANFLLSQCLKCNYLLRDQGKMFFEIMSLSHKLLSHLLLANNGLWNFQTYVTKNHCKNSKNSKNSDLAAERMGWDLIFLVWGPCVWNKRWRSSGTKCYKYFYSTSIFTVCRWNGTSASVVCN